VSRRRVLLVEDDPKTREVVELYLRREGHDVRTAADGLTALEAFAAHAPHLVILDLMLPRLDGREVAQRLRTQAGAAVGIIMVTARATEEDALVGLDLGADDYVTKPFSPRELMARVRALLRRAPDEDVLAAGPVALDRRSHQVRVEGTAVELTPTEFRLLEAFLASPARTFTREELVARAFGADSEAMARTVDAHVMKLRRKLGAAGALVATVFGVGYRLAP
jgi:two-component system, OmpR family, alkaline phosphatase synthesis response regulator PhoP